MGFIRDSFGRVCVESRRESFILHVDHGGAPGPSPEFLTADLDDVIAALSDYRASLPAAGRAAGRPRIVHGDLPMEDECTTTSPGGSDVGGGTTEAGRASATPDPTHPTMWRGDPPAANARDCPERDRRSCCC